MKYDYIIVGSGLFGATFAYRAKHIEKKCLVIDEKKRAKAEELIKDEFIVKNSKDN